MGDNRERKNVDFKEKKRASSRSEKKREREGPLFSQPTRRGRERSDSYREKGASSYRCGERKKG